MKERDDAAHEKLHRFVICQGRRRDEPKHVHQKPNPTDTSAVPKKQKDRNSLFAPFLQLARAVSSRGALKTSWRGVLKGSRYNSAFMLLLFHLALRLFD